MLVIVTLKARLNKPFVVWTTFLCVENYKLLLPPWVRYFEIYHNSLAVS